MTNGTFGQVKFITPYMRHSVCRSTTSEYTSVWVLNPSYPFSKNGFSEKGHGVYNVTEQFLGEYTANFIWSIYLFQVFISARSSVAAYV